MKRFIFTSSFKIYGDQKNFQYRKILTKNKLYAISKNAAEAHVKGFQKYKLNYNIIIFFNVYNLVKQNLYFKFKWLLKSKLNVYIEG